tara:strand:- start:2162 stop:3799 length:1638 start_codon:yes stop_codon:yes gene_type:complete
MAKVLAIVQVGDEWECRCRKQDKEIPRFAGFQWDSGRKSWFTFDSSKVQDLRALCGRRQIKVREAKLPDVQIGPWKGHPSLAQDGPEFPIPPELAYFPFQKGGISYALDRENTLIADEMGLGKTVQAIGVMNADPVETALILCPASLKVQWERALDEWLNYYRSVGIASGPRWPTTHIVIANYDILKNHHDNLRSKTWDVVIADECQYLKNPKAKRTMAVYGDNGKDSIPCKRFLGLTGTPVDSRPIDLFATLRYMLPQTFYSWWEYTLLYCDGHFRQWDYKYSGSSNMRTLGAILRQEVMVRRLKTHVLSQLPSKRREIIELEATPEAIKAVKEEVTLYEQASSASFNLAETGDIVGANDAQLKALSQISKARIQTALAKVKPALEVIRDWIAGEKVVIVCYHRKVMDAFQRAFGDTSVSIHGGVPSEFRSQVVDQFVKDESKRVFIMQVGISAGLDGIQKVCNHGVFFEFDWRSGVMLQAEDRLWRIGQLQGVLWSYFVLPSSIDQKFLQVNGQKAWVASSILDDPAREAAGEDSPAQPGHLF